MIIKYKVNKIINIVFYYEHNKNDWKYVYFM